MLKLVLVRSRMTRQDFVLELCFFEHLRSVANAGWLAVGAVVLTLT